MKNKKKIIIFIVIALISIGTLVFKGYFNNEIYVLNDDKLSTEETQYSKNENNKDDKESINKNEAKSDSSSNKNIGVRDITIYVSGEVNNPGIVTLKSDKRLADAVKALGGVTKKADMNNINLAMKLEDEMHYIIPKKGEKITSNVNSSNLNNYNNSSNIESSNNIDNQTSNNTNSSQSQAQNNKININTATIQELDQIPGVGEATANKILSYREENGNFKSIEEIKNVNGIGDKKFENMKDLICIN